MSSDLLVVPPPLEGHGDLLVALYQRWNQYRGDKLVPHRDDIPLSALLDLLPNTSILEVRTDDVLYRYVGTDVVERTGIDLTGKSLLQMFSPGVRQRILMAADIAIGHPCAIVAAFDTTYESGAKLEIEAITLPVVSKSGKVDQMLALTQPRNRRILETASGGFAMGVEFYEFVAMDIGAGIPAEPNIA